MFKNIRKGPVKLGELCTSQEAGPWQLRCLTLLRVAQATPFESDVLRPLSPCLFESSSLYIPSLHNLHNPVADAQRQSASSRPIHVNKLKLSCRRSPRELFLFLSRICCPSGGQGCCQYVNENFIVALLNVSHSGLACSQAPGPTSCNLTWACPPGMLLLHTFLPLISRPLGRLRPDFLASPGCRPAGVLLCWPFLFLPSHCGAILRCTSTLRVLLVGPVCAYIGGPSLLPAVVRDG